MLHSLTKLFKLCFLSQSKPRTMQKDTLRGIIDSTHSMETASLIRDITLLAIVTWPTDPDEFLQRFMIRSITHCKDPHSTPNHEFLIIRIVDKHHDNDSGSLDLFMYLERTASDIPPPADYFTNHDGTGKNVIINSIVETLKDKVASLLTSRSVSSAPEAYQAIINESEPATSSPSILSPYFDAATLLSAKASLSSSSLSGVFLADDRFTGGNHAGVYAASAHNLRQLVPKSMSLFELAVLADAVHIHNPIYSILKHHCYWYASIICDVINSKYECFDSPIPTSDRRSTDTVHIPPNDYLPPLAGMYLGLSVCKIEEAVLSVMINNFNQHLLEKRKEVRFFFYPERRLLTPRYRYRKVGTTSL
jgi:hypothetical protein